jgi:hypothetical protein
MTVANSFRTAVEKTGMNMTVTANGALANATTHNANLDLFAQMGNYQTLSEYEFERYFAAAWNENPLVALRLLFFNRDVRGGQKVKKFLHHVLHNWTNNNLEFRGWIMENLNLIPEYGYWKDLYHLYGTPVWSAAVGFWTTQIKLDNAKLVSGTTKGISLAAKYAPTESQKASIENNQYKREFLKHFESPKNYRQVTSSLRSHLKIVEKQMSEHNWDEIEYSQVPSVAFLRYRKAFARHDEYRFENFINDDKTTVHAGTLTPVDVYRQYKNANRQQADVEKVWKNLDDVFGTMRDDVRIITVADCSGSMTMGGQVPPIDVAHALTIYCAERNRGVFKNMYMTFSHTAKFYTLSGTSLFSNIQDLRKHSEVANTNVQAVFDEILRVAVNNNVPQEDMPTTLLFLSDMQFDVATGYASNNKRNIDVAREKFAKAGYICPNIIFWNLNSYKNFAGTQHDTGVTLVSGYSEQMLRFVINSEPAKTPLDIMLDVVNSPRYAAITI